ncbi:radical SAM protein [Desulfosoma caldarium]|uniref:Radical SAM family protein n=1 Tax=Desulfosoma caldarium TaxID=610254 RepID=A0A3N1UDT2_9BACT|nr:radical SAM protein [Desulfosoma caldarium]ROQ89565.1 radical SAM family protein [Desulfosoma caldarium]
MRFDFEQGPIRPPSESRSLLLRFTRNCPWNRCAFCPVYKGQAFSRRSLAEIKADIDTVRAIVDDVKALSWSMGEGGAVSEAVLQRILTDSTKSGTYRHVAVWLYHGDGTVFLQDANNPVLRTKDFVEALRYLKERVPGITRVTSYGRSATLARKSLEELREMREAGLDRVHIGLESGSDTVLKFMDKGATAAQHIEAGIKVKEAGMTLSEYVMPGLGGAQWSREHALETARVLEAIDPHFIRLRTLRVPPNTPLWEHLQSGAFQTLSDDDVVREIRLMIENLHSLHSTLTSDHMRNLLENLEGTFPHDKPKLLDIIDQYLALSDDDRILYRLGRYGGALRCVDDLPAYRPRLARARRELEQETGKPIDALIDELGGQYL